MQLKKFSLYGIFFIFLLNVEIVYPLATISLSELTFDKIVRKFPAVLVKFDVAFPYGDKYETYKKLAEETSRSHELLLTEVGVKDYGERENEALARRFNVKKDDFPAVKLFLKDQKKPIDFPKNKDFTLDNLKQFIRDNSDIYIGLPGCIEYYDKLAQQFLNSDNEKRTILVEEAEKKLETLEEVDKRSGKVYILLMNKIIEQGDEFIQKEIKRVQNILKGKLAPAKQAEVQERLNIIQSFVVKKKDEL